MMHFSMLKEEDRREVIEVRHRLLDRVLIPLLGLGLLGVVFGAVQAYQQGRGLFSVIYLGLYLLVLFVSLFKQYIPYSVRAGVLLAAIFLVSAAILVRIGLSGVGIELMILACALCAALMGVRSGLWMTGAGLLAIVIVGSGMISGLIEIHAEHMLNSLSPLAWGTTSMVFCAIAVGLALVPQMFIVRLKQSLELLEAHADKLDRSNQALEQEIRTREVAEGALREAYHIINMSPAVAFLWKNEEGWPVAFVSENVEILFGYKAEEFVSAQVVYSKTVHAGDLERVAGEVAAFSQQEERERFTHKPYRIVAKNGEVKWVEDRTFIRRDRTGRITHYQGIVEDITERIRTEEALKESEAKFLELFDEAPVGYHELDIHGRITRVNRTELEMLGYTEEEVLGLPVWELIAEGEISRQGVLAKLAGVRPPNRGLERNYRRKDGTTFPVLIEERLLEDSEGRIIGIRSTVQDITEPKQAEKDKENLKRQLDQAQKMETIGTLAGGIAHDFNNILTPIIVHTEMVLDDTPKESPSRFSLQEVLKAAERARDLVKQILAFSRQTEGQQISMKIAPVVKEALKLLRATLPTTIEIRSHIETESGPILADPTQIHQVLMNLCTNAAFAMRKKGGALEIGIVNESLDSKAAAGIHDLPPGSYLRLSVSDTGQGMTPEVMEHIFEPYFTTKKKGEGTGLGLAVVHGIVTSLGGEITVESAPERGTTFHVYLPVVEREVSSETQMVAPLPRGEEHILLVDDEKAMVDAMQLMLGRLGYKVTARTSSVEALEVFRADPTRFDLVITDLTMPNLTGTELAMELMKIRPGIPMILCTGFSELIDGDKAKAMGIRGFLMKPIVMTEMAANIRHVLDKE